MALDDRYHSEFVRQDRFHDFDHRDRGRYQDHSLDRSARDRGSPSHTLKETQGLSALLVA